MVLPPWEDGSSLASSTGLVKIASETIETITSDPVSQLSPNSVTRLTYDAVFDNDRHHFPAS